MSDVSCYHCGLAVMGDVKYTADINGQTQPMCCPGCKAVAETIVAGGLKNYYQFRTEQATPNAQDNQSLDAAAYQLYDQESLQADFVSKTPEGLSSAQFAIEGITCAACVWLLEHHLKQREAVTQVSVNLTTHRARIVWDPAQTPLSELMAQIRHIGYRAHPYTPDKEEQLRQKERKRALMRLGVAGIGMMQVMMMAVALYGGALQGIEDKYVTFIRWSSLALATPVVFFAAAPFFIAAWRDLKTKHLTMDLPVSIAIGGAYTASVWATLTESGEVYFDSVTMFTFFLLIGRFLEMQARHRTGLAGNAIANLLPASARKLSDVNDTSETLVPAAELRPDDIVRVLVGETLPADGVVVSGHSQVDEAALTGEYLPVSKTPGDSVVGGTFNVEQPLVIKVTTQPETSKVTAITQLLERAQSEKPKVALIADKVASYFVGAVLTVGLTVYLVWHWLSPDDALWITLSVLVVTCPCALSLATPTALTAATGSLRQLGLLVTRGHVLQALTESTHAVFDKTGTLTQGALSIDDIVVCGSANLTIEQAQVLAASLESHSNHPIANAFAQVTGLIKASDVSVATSQGIEGILDGTRYRIGKPSYAAALYQNQQLPSPIAPSEQAHWLLLANEQGPMAWFALKDPLRPDASTAVKQLEALGLEVIMLTGDSSYAAEMNAKALGISRYQKDASAQDKLDYIQALQSQGARVLMVGDGINDIPCLAAATTSVAMQGASDLAKTSADAVLLNGQLQTLVNAIELAHKTKGVIRQNLTWSLLYNVLALPLAAMGFIPPYLAAIGMSASSLVVVTNAIRLTRKPKKQSTVAAPRQPLTAATTAN
ncbi:MAG: heavy metal translocating P-type ATPase [Pontibacterium sp.]